MEIITEASEETGIPQYKLLEKVDVNNNILIYQGKNSKISFREFLEPLYYLREILPSAKQTISATHDLLIYFKQRFQEYIWNHVEDFVFYYYIQRTLLYRIRGKDPEKAFTIRYRWEMQKYIHKEKRLRREKQIRYYRHHIICY